MRRVYIATLLPPSPTHRGQLSVRDAQESQVLEAQREAAAAAAAQEQAHIAAREVEEGLRAELAGSRSELAGRSAELAEVRAQLNAESKAR